MDNCAFKKKKKKQEIFCASVLLILINFKDKKKTLNIELEWANVILFIHCKPVCCCLIVLIVVDLMFWKASFITYGQWKNWPRSTVLKA